jgi:cell shape-determining protein MreD
MKILLYLALMLLIVPLQTTLLSNVSVLGVRPDLALIAVCLVGFFGGELDGLLLGVVLGWSQDLLSAGEVGVNLISKGGAGFLAGLAGRHLAHITLPVLAIGLAAISCVSSLVFVYTMNISDWDLSWPAMPSRIVIQGMLDAALGTAAYGAFLRRSTAADVMIGERY